MSQKFVTLTPKPPAESVVRDILRATRRPFSVEGKTRILLGGLRDD